MESSKRSAQYAERLDVRIAVKDFGPIAAGEIQLRPLTVFVGPSNAGKTYLAVLLYAIHKVLGGLTKYSIINNDDFSITESLLEYFIEIKEADRRENHNDLASQLETLSAKLDNLERPFTFLDLPMRVRDEALTLLKDPDRLADDIKDEVLRCFDVQSFADLVRAGAGINKMEIGIQATQSDEVVWHFDTTLSASGLSSRGAIGNISLDEPENRDTDFGMRIRQLPQLIDSESFTKLFRLFSDLATTEGAEAFYLPAARSGIMQSHRVIASSIMRRATRAGLERLPELPTFSGVLVDFMQRLILYREKSVSLRLRRGRGRRRLKVIPKLAERLEQETLGGSIRMAQPSPGGYPEFFYHPKRSNQKIGLSRASSMVTELAPVVLCLRDGVGKGDTLIIEEPEAHLHPAAQTQMAELLSQLVNAGVRVIVTTHSDWLLKALANLMREGVLRTETDSYADSDGFPGTAIRPEDAGIWLFQSSSVRDGSTVEEIPFDSVSGVAPGDYDVVDEELYNRAAELQNRMAERDRDETNI